MSYKSLIDSHRRLASAKSNFKAYFYSSRHSHDKPYISRDFSCRDISWRNRRHKFTCEHLENLKNILDLKCIYRKIHTNFIFSISKATRYARARLVRCGNCKKKDGFLLCCLQCVYVGCIKGGHMKQHAKEHNHPLACDLQRGTLYCYKCVDVIFDQDFEPFTQIQEKRSEYSKNIPWSSKVLSRRHLNRMSGARTMVALSPKSTFGLRGFINLGHTCFMNCIVQTFMHTPLLRDFFLSERIVCHEKHNDRNKNKPCIVTHLCDLYHEFYKGNKTPMSLHALLYKIWANAAHLAGYEQQDAHEFFTAMLEALHLHFNSPSANGTCNCIIDLLFHGRLESVLTCMVCRRNSVKVDPIWDVSLDLTIDPLDQNASITLYDCLNRYTRLEHLGSSTWCERCQGIQEFSKQLKFQLLPVVLCLHLKRFEHSSSYKKIDKSIKFPEHLDLTPYTSGFDDRKKVKNKRQLRQAATDSEFRYSLYAVVNHVGSGEGGHYYSYIRNTRDDWYKCDDHLITSVTREEVLKCPGYLLFYHRSSIYYRETKTYLKNHSKAI